MESKSMELKVMRCNDLQAFNFFQKLLVYVLVSLVSEDPDKKLKQNQQQRTPTDTEDDGNPEWNHEMKFDLSEVSFVYCDHVFVLFDLRHEGLYFGDKTIGEVRVPLKDLIQESSGITRFVNYQVRSPEGKPNGILNFSYKVNAQGNDMGIHFPTSEITGYSVVHHHHHHHESSEIQYPASEAESSLPAVHYPPLESGDNSGYSVVVHHHHESSEIRYPTSEAESSSPVVHYPPLESGDYSQETYPAAEASYPTQGTHQGNPYPPTPYAYYPPSQPPPPPFLHRPPPSRLPLPPFLHGPPPPHGACYQPHYPPELSPWARLEVYDYNAHGNWSRTDGHSHSFGHGETQRHD